MSAEVAVEALEACQEEDGVVALLLYFAAPIPCARQAPVNARTAVGARAIKAVLEEVCYGKEPRAKGQEPRADSQEQTADIMRQAV